MLLAILLELGCDYHIHVSITDLFSFIKVSPCIWRVPMGHICITMFRYVLKTGIKHKQFKGYQIMSKKTELAFTLSRITNGPATPETVLYSAIISQKERRSLMKASFMEQSPCCNACGCLTRGTNNFSLITNKALKSQIKHKFN